MFVSLKIEATESHGFSVDAYQSGGNFKRRMDTFEDLVFEMNERYIGRFFSNNFEEIRIEIEKHVNEPVLLVRSQFKGWY